MSLLRGGYGCFVQYRKLTTVRGFIMRAYKSEQKAEEKFKGRDGLVTNS